MASLKALKLRIGSVKSTQKITKAMKMVAAAKLRRAQDAAQSGRPYAERLTAVMETLASKVATSASGPLLLSGTGSDQKHLLVVATSERGLAGAFNTNIVRAARRLADELTAQGKTVHFHLAGKKGRVLKRFYPQDVTGDHDLSGVKKVAFTDAQGLAQDLIARYEAGEFDVAHLFYARFVSAIVQEPVGVQIIPVPLATARTAASSPTSADAVVAYEPDEEAMLAELLPRNVAVQLFRALQENAASEQGSRMNAMDNATRNAGDMINRLSIQYNRTRQAAITTELIEIIAGAEAV
ncbi:F0F1 ATP synthase subunit gamma [uncultured Sphingomonas sp.]|uniref:F0F1 ATP synthase subunit gamma n=1 Tax=uncultured Sphingomonas sp. TaxID=158754 RepID=UPI0035CA1310